MTKLQLFATSVVCALGMSLTACGGGGGGSQADLTNSNPSRYSLVAKARRRNV